MMFKRIRRGFRALTLTIVVTVSMVFSLIATPSATAQTTAVVRVDGIGGSTSPAGQGNGWGSNAYLHLQDGLARADVLLAQFDQVQLWVLGSSTGISYRPDQGSGFTADDPSATFEMRVNVHVYGGFDTSDTALLDADPVNNLTILTGEIGTASDFSDNSYHVVTADDGNMTDQNCLLQGFTITRGNADTEDSSAGGGGINISNSADLRIDRCIITDNRSGDGGYGAGIQVRGSNPVITRCVISNNQNLDSEVLYGGGIVIHESSGTSSNPVRIIDCTISGNRAAHGGGISVKQPPTPRSSTARSMAIPSIRRAATARPSAAASESIAARPRPASSTAPSAATPPCAAARSPNGAMPAPLPRFATASSGEIPAPPTARKSTSPAAPAR